MPKLSKPHAPNPAFQLSEIQDYVLNAKNIADILRTVTPPTTSAPKPAPAPCKITAQAPDSHLIPKFKDKLFWCFYIIHNGLSEYELVGGSGFKEEKCAKIDLVSKVRSNKALLKANKWKKTEVEDELVNKAVISMPTFMCICAIFQYNVVIIDDRKFYQQISTDQLDETHIVHKLDVGYGLELCCKSDVGSKITELRDTHWLISNIAKPLNAMSSYRVKALKDICARLKISVVGAGGKRMSRQEMYERILLNL